MNFRRPSPGGAEVGVALALALVLGGCERGRPGATPSPDAARPAAGERPAGVTFEDHAKRLGVDFVHSDGSSGQYFIVETLASGVALWDYDNDGRLDIYFPNGRMLPPGTAPTGAVARAHRTNVLYHQEPDGTFKDVTQEAGVAGTGFGVGCCVGDIDADGHLDLYVTQYGPNVLYRNRGDGTFEDATAHSGVGDARFGAGAVFFDYDADGDLDLYVSNYCFVDFQTNKPCLHNNVKGYCAPETYPAAPDILYRNNGDGTFSDVSDESGILATGRPGRGMGVIATDFTGNGRLDVFVANDGSENFLFENRGGGKFEEAALISGVAVDGNGDEQGCMGVDAADYDLDGRLDLIVTNYQKQPNALYEMRADGDFADVSLRTRFGSKSLPWVGWGTKFFDFDNDRLLDVFVANGHLEDGIEGYEQSSTYLQRNQLLRNTGKHEGKVTFEDVSAESGPGLGIVLSSRGAAFGDIDNDGDIDIVVSNSRQRPNILINQGGNRNHWMGFRLIGKTDPFALNARVTVTVGDQALTQEVRSGTSYVSQNDLRLHFGLGPATRIDRVEVRWPDGGSQDIPDVRVDAYTVIRQN